jgi:hypothetical protein
MQKYNRDMEKVNNELNEKFKLSFTYYYSRK